MIDTPHRTPAELEAGLDNIRMAPKDGGTLAMIVRRPRVDARELLEAGELNTAEGLAGDTWRTRGSSRTPDRSSHPDMQVTLMNARAVDLIAGSKARWPLAGDQLLVDLDLSEDNLPPGTRLSIGAAVVEITAQPHTGCDKFAARFGRDALKWVNSPIGRQLRLRGVNTRVVQPGAIRVGDRITRV